VKDGARLAWLAAALLFVVIWMARSLWPALDSNVVQDDARQHVFWMQRLEDPSLLRDDLYADYFASQAPGGYVLLYRALLLVTDPLAASKLLPPVLGLVAALFTFLLVERLYPSRPAAFLTTVLGSWYVWQYDDLASGSPRGFLLPLTAALLYGLVAGWRWWVVAGVVAIEALVYPSAAALGVMLVGARLVTLDHWPPRLTTDWRAWRAVAASGLVCVLLLAPTVFGGSPFGPTVDAATARTMPEFGPSGRNAFFVPDPYELWIVSYRSGFDLRVTDVLVPGLPILYWLLALAGLLPLAAVIRRWRPGGPSLRPAAVLIAQVVAASLVLFLLAHLLLFRLYLPARFVAWTVPLALAIAAGVGIVAVLESATMAWPREGSRSSRRTVVGAAVMILAIGLAAYPARFDGNFVLDRTPAITGYLRALPPDALVVGVPIETDSVPAFSGRPVLVNREYALAYHLGFYRQVERRAREVIEAYYSETPGPLVDLVNRYGVTVFLVNRAAFDPATAADAWAGNFAPHTADVMERMERGRPSALEDMARRCGVLTEGDVTVVPAACIVATR
jgi:hypothetical protein